eukprot:1256977-Pleurochrysis_carterae.AAC.1
MGFSLDGLLIPPSASPPLSLSHTPICLAGRTVLCTIHQPRPDIFSLFDTLLLLSAGEVAFFGPRANIASYLGTLAISIPPDVNPADFVVDLTYSHETNSVVEQLVKGWNGSTDGMQMSALVRQLEQRSLPGLGSTYRCVETCFGTHGVASGSFARSMRWQIYILMDRSYVNLFRSPDFWRRIWLVPLLQYLFFGLVYVGTRYKTPYVAPGFTEADVELDNFSLLVRQKRSFYFQVRTSSIDVPFFPSFSPRTRLLPRPVPSSRPLLSGCTSSFLTP